MKEKAMQNDLWEASQNYLGGALRTVSNAT